MDKVLKQSSQDQEKHMMSVKEALGSAEKGPPSQKRLHLLNYTAILAGNTSLATIMTRIGVLNILVKQFKDTSHLDVYVQL